MKCPPLIALYEDNHCLAVLKPARMLIAGDQTGDLTLLELARVYVRNKYHKPGRVFLGLVHRLDRPVSGVVVFARTSKAAARLSEQFRKGTVRKVYQAVVEGEIAARSGELCDWLVKDAHTNIVRRAAAGAPGARRSVLCFRRIRTGRGLTLLEVTPQTGRSHQIRVQLAALGHPICGDKKYGSPHSFGGAIALHAAELSFEHPVRRKPIVVRAEAPHEFCALLGRET